jgi:hypothetical protein
MKSLTVSNRRTVISTARALGALLVAGTLEFYGTWGYAQERPTLSRPNSLNATDTLTNVEQAFWACDYAATTRWVGADEGATCGAIYEELKKSKFGGDFHAMLEWWQNNKTAEHQALARERRPSIAR